jgi:hypothetical protein
MLNEVRKEAFNLRKTSKKDDEEEEDEEEEAQQSVDPMQPGNPAAPYKLVIEFNSSEFLGPWTYI